MSKRSIAEAKRPSGGQIDMRGNRNERATFAFEYDFDD
jgi:hypothetical protein